MPKRNHCPWQQANYNYGIGIIALHEEIRHFYQYILPTPCEHTVRIRAIRRVERLIQGLWPQAVVEVFGSFRTGLFLPNSDIDLVVLGRWKHLPLRTLQERLLAHGITEEGTLHVLENATVPIIRFTDRDTKIKFDLSFNLADSVQSAELIKNFKREYPELGQLVLVLKQFMVQRELNNVFAGGLSSYSLILMCISFLQLHPRDVFVKTANLGVLLLEFFELYGLRFNYSQIGISIRSGGCYMENKCMSDLKTALYIDDPLHPGNNIARGTHAIMRIKQAFQRAYCVLNQAVNPLNLCNSRQQKVSILGQIINISSKLSAQRALWHNNYIDLLKIAGTLPQQTTACCPTVPQSSSTMITEADSSNENELPKHISENENAKEISIENVSTE